MKRLQHGSNVRAIAPIEVRSPKESNKKHENKKQTSRNRLFSSSSAYYASSLLTILGLIHCSAVAWIVRDHLPTVLGVTLLQGELDRRANTTVITKPALLVALHNLGFFKGSSIVQTFIFKLPSSMKPFGIRPSLSGATDSISLHYSPDILHKLIPALLIYHAFGCSPTHQITLCCQ